MKDALSLVGSLFVFSWLCLSSVQGLECYDCQYVDGISENEVNADYPYYEKDMFDKSCHTGKKPDKKFLEKCSKDEVCVKAVYKGKHPKNSKDVTMTGRTCAPYLEPLSKLCDGKAVSELEKDPVLKPYLNVSIDGLKGIMDVSQTKLNFCFCDSDKCNAAASILPTAIYGVASLIMSIFVTGKFVC